MQAPAIFFLTLTDHQGELITSARVRLMDSEPIKGQGLSFQLEFNGDLGLYQSEPLPTGTFQLEVKSKSFLDETLTVTLQSGENYDKVVLGKDGMPYYFENGRKHYFETVGNQLAALTAPPESEAASRGFSMFDRHEALRPCRIAEEDDDTPPDVILLDRVKADKSLTQKQWRKEIVEAEDILDAGPRMKNTSPQVLILSSSIELNTIPGISEKELAKAVKPFKLLVQYQDRYDPTLFVVQSTLVIGPEFGKMPERLLELDMVRSARSLLNSRIEPDVPIFPGDPNFSLQFHHHLTRLPEAWEALNPANAATSFGSADVVVAVHDSGIATAGTGAVITHPEFSGTVTGGNLTGQPGLNNNKVLFSYDFRPMAGGANPIVLGNDGSTSSHGSWTSGVISAATDGATGVVGAAANTRLCSYIFHTNSASARFAHPFDFMAGFLPAWSPGAGGYQAAQVFPAPFNTGENPVPGAFVINCSHTLGAMPPTMTGTLQRITLFGRNRRGTLVIASAGNDDSDTRNTGVWGENHNVMRISASSMDVREEEVRMNYSSFALIGDRAVDCCAPSESQNISPTVHQAPHMLGFISVDRITTSGNLATNVNSRAPVTNAPNPALATATVSAANFPNFGVGDQVILRDTINQIHAELHTILAVAPPVSITLSRPPGYTYIAGQVELIRLGGTNGYTTGFGGTSAAAPQVSSLAALMISANPALSWLEVRDMIRSTAVPINLRYRGSRYAAAPHFRYRWIDTTGGAPVDILDADGLLNITGGNKTTSVGPLNAGTRFLTLNNTAGINPRQALLIGVETKLNGAHPLAAPNASSINVDRAADFAPGDQLFIGRHSRTVIINPAAVGDTIIWVQSVDGFLPGENIDLDPGGPNAETVRIVSIRRIPRQNAPPPPTTFGAADTGFNISRLNVAGNPIPGGLTNAHNRAEIAESNSTQREGPFTVNLINLGANQLTLNAAVTNTHPDDRIVYKANTELKAVIRLIPPNRVEIDPLDFTHPFNANGIEHIRVGRIASYSLGFGHGRIDAFEAVQAAQNYNHSLRDLVLRNHLNDDGSTTTAANEVHSPDIWIRNDAATTLAALPNYADAPPHQFPQITIDPAMFAGTGVNDLQVSGNCTSAAEVLFTIEIDATPGAPNADTFKWKKDQGAYTNGVAISGAAQALSDGVSIQFAGTSGHTLGDVWMVQARQVANRFLHVRTYNNGTQPFYQTSALGVPASRLDIARSRLLLCLSDNTPVARFSSISAAPGTNDLEVTGSYTGLNVRALYSVVITAVAAGGDTFQWFRDGAGPNVVVLTAATLTQVFNDGVQVTFGSHTGHAVGDRWDIYARNADADLNLDHFWPFNETPAYNPSTAGTGTLQMQEFPISGLASKTARIDSIAWPEAQRPPTNNPNTAKPATPRRLYVLGEVVPHDGPLIGHTAKTNNNISYRELAFAKFRLSTDNGLNELEQHLDVDALGVSTVQPFRAEIRTTAGFFQTENTRIKLTAKRTAMPDDVVEFQYDTGLATWRFLPAAPAWANLNAPLEARRPDATQPAAAGEQFDIQFDGDITVDKTFTEIIIEPQIRSHFRPQVVAFEAFQVSVYQKQPLPSGVGGAIAALIPRPSSWVFSDMATLVPGNSFGPVSGDQFRTGAYFTAPGTVKAYALTKGFVAIQRDPANNNAVNLILRPFKQPIPGFTPLRYVIYRGLQLADFLNGTAGNDAKILRAQAGASQLIQDIWADYLALNPGETEVPSTVMGYDPDNQNGGDPLDNVFFKVGADQQLYLVEGGAELGNFITGSAFGIEIMLEEGAYEPDLNFARAADHLIDLSGMPTGTAAEQFAKRIRREEIHHFIDPAAFYGLHLHDNGKVEVPGGTTHIGDDIFVEVVSKFATKHLHYLDIRSENGDSLNFHQNYDDGSGNQVQTGIAAAALNPAPYSNQSWPILIIDQSATVNTANTKVDHFIQLRIDDNEKPVLYLEHGLSPTAASNGAFYRGDQIRNVPNMWSETLQLQVPATGAPNSRQGVAWISRLHFGRLANPNPTNPRPNTVLAINQYTDNVFGPIDRDSSWAGAANIEWAVAQDGRYVDAETELGWQQMMSTGIGSQSGATDRVLLFGTATQNDTNSVYDVVATKGISDGVSQKTTFFEEKGLFGNYLLEQDQINDGANIIRTLRLQMNPKEGFPPTNALLLGISETEFDTLKALNNTGQSTDHLRYIVLDSPQQLTDTNGIAYTKYKLGIHGLTAANATLAIEFPPNDIEVFSLDGHGFYSKAFGDAEPLPTAYIRNFEEEKGARLVTARERHISAVNSGANTVTINAYDWTEELVVGDQLKIDKSSGNNGQYPVTAISLNGNDTVITIGGAGIVSSATPLGSAFTVPKPIEDFFIDKDQQGQLSGLGTLRSLVDGFINNVAGIANNASAKNNLTAQVNDAGPKILTRARALVDNDRSRGSDFERALYWARNRMAVALKSHAYSLASLSGRNELIKLLDDTSRGLTGNLNAAPGGAQKILLTAFDPMQVALDLEAGNISSAVALALHGKTITSSGNTAYFEGMHFPLRYQLFDSGQVETIADPLLNGGAAVNMILNLNQQNQGTAHIDVERLASRSRGGEADNNFSSLARQPLGDDANFNAYYESSLPITQFVPGPFGAGQDIYFDESYTSTDPAQSASHPSAGGANGNASSFALNTITGSAQEGSAGSYLPNELFYRIARRRAALGSTTLCGLVQLPSAAASGKTTTELITEVEDMIRRWLDSLP